MLAPEENCIALGVPALPFKIVLDGIFAKLVVVCEKVTTSKVIPKGLATTELVETKSFQIAGESQPSPFLSLLLWSAII